LRGDVFAAFLNHPLDPVFGDEILVGDLNDFEIALPGFCPERVFRQTATKEQLARIGKRNRFVILDVHHFPAPPGQTFLKVSTQTPQYAAADFWSMAAGQ
jgi:hypothetical protein